MLRAMLLAAAAALAGCCDDAATSDMAAADLARPSGDGDGHQCGDGLTGVTCGARQCPRRAWCDTSGATPVCRCGDLVTNVTPDCICTMPDPSNPSCGLGPAGCA